MNRTNVCVCVYAQTHTHTHTHIHTNGILFNPKKKKEFLSFVTICMNLEGTMLNGISQTKKNKYFIGSFICRILFLKVVFIETENRKVVARAKGGGGIEKVW